MAHWKEELKEIVCSFCRWLCSTPGKEAGPRGVLIGNSEAGAVENEETARDTQPTPEVREPVEEPEPAPSAPPPTPVRFVSVCLDPGHHAGIANASPDKSYFEWAGNWDMAMRVRALLEEDGFEVVLTIEDPERMIAKRETVSDFKQRAGVALGAKVKEGVRKVFLSIHSNASEDKDGDGWGEGEGMEMFVRGSDEGSKEFARALLYGLLDSVPGLKDRTKGVGYKVGNFAVLRYSNPLPAVLLEVDFHDHPRGLERLKDEQFRQRFAEGIVKGVKVLNSVYEKRGF